MRTWDPRQENDIIQPDNIFNESVETDVEGIASDGVYKKGFDSFPLFDVTENEFLSNMETHRQRCRFTTPKVAEYMQNSRYKKPFYIRYQNEQGKIYVRKVK